MSALTSADLIKMFRALSERIEAEKGFLCELDGHIGDADHGIAMAQGFGAVARALDALDPAAISPTDVFNTAAKSFLNAVGASSGPLYATAFMRAGAAFKGKDAIAADEAPAIIEAMARGIQDRGKAEPGDKTMIDAWQPAAVAAAAGREAGKPAAEVFAAARKAAEEGAAATAGMVASKGRSSRLGERSLGHVDPGAASAAIVVAVMAESLAG
ncbi:dihydroxyacetone kinase subunit DhaL [Kumtagia ephedrae]|jgi:dihydroxyacetone kinase-like protein|uniref:Dihydroxyacetone kinase subunit L n=1 Tax=Kumtagia ephedrae TaxID=2116701 RepID=A0A2P7SJG9_9HYPH|nr:dihydroxyacetone kinase subunit DhaL [Mesorhizobium ephedrae]PSJ62624.1 dihydroxyacetone kinase subunit L [Mesorhizobium ephedrae]